MLKIVDRDVEEVKRVITIFLLSLLRNGGQTVELPSCQVNLTQLTERLSIVRKMIIPSVKKNQSAS